MILFDPDVSGKGFFAKVPTPLSGNAIRGLRTVTFFYIYTYLANNNAAIRVKIKYYIVNNDIDLFFSVDIER